MTRALLEQALVALVWHKQQTRPIDTTDIAIEAIRNELAKPEPARPVQPSCWCTRCDLEVNTHRSHMATCPLCGDKRCPRAEDHRNDCAKTAPYDQTALELCETCGWKTLIPGEGCLNCERPAWHDAPNGPGLWVNSISGEARQISTFNIQSGAWQNTGARWFGPISGDSGESHDPTV